MKFTTLSTLAFFLNGALAADCIGTKQRNGISDKHMEAYWEVREKMCSNSDCASQQPCTTYASRTGGFITITLNAELKRKNTASKQGYKDCWDATENIIQQCMKNGYLTGTWEANGQLYQLSGTFKA
ncbi:unnamed protein product [Fusarium graminearum]|uniref:Ecp2 effector protein domain-containing protein n=1 Tax=Gibberella zeae TaxID=5518 RepID=A0A679NZ93_GIBZA|nr:unnamed protein product [Fusarium graminearum]CAG1965063.1 unnamed protein product [Fusarium graminearum]CAG2014728.1 unnamed protein product [Fusarium graminearum]CZS79640.1 unnamed protein product [Fusarium graminearum]